MPVQITDHATNGFLQQLGIIDGFDILALDPLHHFQQQSRLVFLELGRRQLPFPGQHAPAQRQADTKNGANHQYEYSSCFQ